MSEPQQRWRRHYTAPALHNRTTRYYTIHYTHYTTLHYTTLHDTTPLQCSTLRCSTHQRAAVHYTALTLPALHFDQLIASVTGRENCDAPGWSRLWWTSLRGCSTDAVGAACCCVWCVCVCVYVCLTMLSDDNSLSVLLFQGTRQS